MMNAQDLLAFLLKKQADGNELESIQLFSEDSTCFDGLRWVESIYSCTYIEFTTDEEPTTNPIKVKG